MYTQSKIINLEHLKILYIYWGFRGGEFLHQSPNAKQCFCPFVSTELQDINIIHVVGLIFLNWAYEQHALEATPISLIMNSTTSDRNTIVMKTYVVAFDVVCEYLGSHRCCRGIQFLLGCFKREIMSMFLLKSVVSF